MKNLNSYKYIDLFAGCGGLSLGLKEAGWKGLFAIEKSPQAFNTLRHNLIEKASHFEWVNWLPRTHHDINNVLKNYKKELQELRGEVTMVAGGPPCQGFSTAGRRKENDNRNDLVKSYVEFIRLVEPSIIFFENVKGFTLEFKKNKSKGKVYANEVEHALENLGYQVKGELINFADYGVPQKRTRFILVGVRKNRFSSTTANSFFELLEEQKETFLRNKKLGLTTSLEEAISDLLKSNGTVQSPDTPSFNAGTYGKVKSNYQKLLRENVKKSEVVDSHRFAKHYPKTIEKFSFAIEQNIVNKNIATVVSEKFGGKKRNLTVLDRKSASPTLTTNPDDYIHYSEPRIMTVREYARIQSFPDTFEFKAKYTTGGKLRVKEVPRYTQVGNAIPPLFAEQSGLALIEILQNARK